MGMTRRLAEKMAVQSIPTPLLDLAGRALIEGIDKAVESRWTHALDVAAQTNGASPAETARLIAAPIKRTMTAAGAAAGATAAAPGIGTSVAAGALVTELGFVALRTADMVMAVGAAYGHTDATAEERRAWVLAVLAFGDDAHGEFVSLARDLDLRSSYTARAHKEKSLELANQAIVGSGAGHIATVDALRRINTTLVAQVLKKWGTRRGMATFGKLLPFGVGAAVGGSANFMMLRELNRQTIDFFEEYDRDFVLGFANDRPEGAIDAQSRRR